MKGLGKSSHVFQLHPSTPENFNLNSELAHLIFANLLQLFAIVTEGWKFLILFSQNLNLLDLISYC